MFISPMLLQPIAEPFDDPEWLSELKLDGIRLICSNQERRKLYTRYNNDVTERFPELSFNLPKGVILDGELIKADTNGKPDFEALMSRFNLQNKKKGERLAQFDPVIYCAFDVLYYQGKNITHWPLMDRKELLEELIPEESPSLAKVRYVKGQGTGLFKACYAQELEGIVLKKSDSPYKVGKRPDGIWYKVVNYKYADVWIVGYRKSKLGWVLAFEDGRPAGIMELGIPPEARQKLYSAAKVLPYTEKGDIINFNDSSNLKCRIKYRNLTKSGLLRLPSYEKWLS